jgi:hypothetical protein
VVQCMMRNCFGGGWPGSGVDENNTNIRSKRRRCMSLPMNNSGQRKILPNPISLSSRITSTEKVD